MDAACDTLLSLSIDPSAFERCFVTGQILAEDYEQAGMEFGLLGLSALDDPLHVLATLLLSGQRVTPVSVEQSGHAVLHMRREIAALSNRMGRQLVATTFIHNHNGSPDASITDDEFLTGPFVDQVSTAVAFVEVLPVNTADLHCDCATGELCWRERVANSLYPDMVRIEFSLAFSLIITRQRDHRLYAARKDHCTQCRRSRVRFVPARLALDATQLISNAELEAMRELLRREIAEKVEFTPQSLEMEGIA
jgi:hypothetical protein